MAGKFGKKVYGFLKVISGYAFFSRIELTKRFRTRHIFITALAIVLILLCIIFDSFLPFPLQLAVWIIGGLYFLGMVSWALIVSDRHSIRNYIILFSAIMVSFIFKRFHWIGGSILIVVSLSILACGFFIYSIKLFFTVENNLYLKLLGTLACIVIWMSSLGILFKYQHWPGAGLAIYISLPPLLILTLVVLLTLPSSGYIRWPKSHRQILTRKLLFPWIFLLAFVALKTLLPPELQKQIFEKESSEIIPFDMEDYELPKPPDPQGNQ